MIMYDSVNVDAIPSTATDLLAYTDGNYANVGQMRARFPNARIHTISDAGQVLAEWIDVEVGCVWPVESAVAVYRAWRGLGCKGFYGTQSTLNTVKQYLGSVQIDPNSAEYFDADWTNVEHVDPGYVATQYENTPAYDISDTTPAFEGTIPTPQQIVETPMYTFSCTTPGHTDFVVAGDRAAGINQAQLDGYVAAKVPGYALTLVCYQQVCALLGVSG